MDNVSTAAQPRDDLAEADHIAEMALRRLHSIGATDAEVLGACRMGLALEGGIGDAGRARLRHLLRTACTDYGLSAPQIDSVLGKPAALSEPAPKPRRQRAKVIPLPPSDALPEGVEPFSDLANAYRLVREHGAELRHCTALGWLGWTGTVWARAEGEAHRRAMQVAQRLMRYALAMLERAQSDEDRERADAYLSWARRSQAEPAIRRSLALAMHLPPIAGSIDDFDRDPWLFNVANGTLDLRTCELHEHRPADMLTRCSPVAYDAAAVAPTFERFIAEALPDPEVRAFVRRFVGYCLTGLTTEQCFAVLWGDGGNGKSVLLELLRYALGAYALEAAADTFTRNAKGRGSDNKLADLRGVRMATTSETGEGKGLDEVLVKRCTGGDQITANHLYGETFRYHPQFKLWMCTNHRPEIRGVDLGIWRRVRLVPFTVTIPPERQDRDLPAKLSAEVEGVLAWAVEGCRQWRTEGLQPPAAVVAATDEWKADANDVATFVGERCVTLEGAAVLSGPLFEAYRAWAQGQGCEVLTGKAFTARLERLGHRRSRTARGARWQGLGLRTDRDGGDDD